MPCGPELLEWRVQLGAAGALSADAVDDEDLGGRVVGELVDLQVIVPTRSRGLAMSSVCWGPEARRSLPEDRTSRAMGRLEAWWSNGSPTDTNGTRMTA